MGAHRKCTCPSTATHTDTLVYINAKQKQATHTQAHAHTHVWPGLSCRANAAKFMILFHACFSLTFSFVADPLCSILPCAAKNYNFFFWLLCYSPVALPPAARLPVASALPLVNLFQVAFTNFFLPCSFLLIFAHRRGAGGVGQAQLEAWRNCSALESNFRKSYAAVATEQGARATHTHAKRCHILLPLFSALAKRKANCREGQLGERGAPSGQWEAARSVYWWHCCRTACRLCAQADRIYNYFIWNMYGGREAGDATRRTCHAMPGRQASQGSVSHILHKNQQKWISARQHRGGERGRGGKLNLHCSWSPNENCCEINHFK